MLKQLQELGIEFQAKSKYNVACPECSKGRSKSGTRSLGVKVNLPYINYKCFHDPICPLYQGGSLKVEDGSLNNIIIEETKLNYIPILNGEYPYQDKDTVFYHYFNPKTNERVFLIARKNLPDGKKLIRPFALNQDGDWYCSRPDIKTLYRIESLTSDLKRPVIIVEGEKTADKAATIFTKADVVSWVGGANATHTGSWDALKGRSVILWPDNDLAGINAMIKVSESLGDIADTVRLVDTTGLPDGWDLADNHITLEEIGKRYKHAKVVSKPLLRGLVSWDEVVQQMAEKPSAILTSFGFSLPANGVGVIMGRTNHGKSALMINLACDLLQHQSLLNVAFISYEVNLPELADRFKQCLPESELKSYVDCNRLLLSDQNINVSELESLMKRWKGRGIRGVIFLDYIQVMPHIDKDMSQRYVQVKNLVQAIRRLGNENGHLIVTGSQTTPGNTGGKDNPFQDQARESRDIEFTSSLMLKIWNKKVATARTQTEAFTEVEGDFVVQVIKSRIAEDSIGKTVGLNFLNGTKLEKVKSKFLTTSAF